MLDQFCKEMNERLDLLRDSAELLNLNYSDKGMVKLATEKAAAVLALAEKTRDQMQQLEVLKSKEQELTERSLALFQLAASLSFNMIVNMPPAPAPVALPPPSLPQPQKAPEAVIRRNGTAVSYIAGITTEEFDAIPKYMRGSSKMTKSAIDKFIADFNKAVAAKYSLLTMPKNEMKPCDKTKCQEYRRQETPETKGKTFVTEQDMLGPPMGKKLQDFSVVLRHLGRTREVRGKGLVRYVVV
ncbi:spindle and kinetochore-associated protein 1-like [Ornithodoros turicata]|uniref:spindle and kinetochore-associated protein 1-like n=1 Tax=Ornithodoros turicata TaxID=34597 RepID=UPI0031389F5F